MIHNPLHRIAKLRKQLERESFKSTVDLQISKGYDSATVISKEQFSSMFSRFPHSCLREKLNGVWKFSCYPWWMVRSRSEERAILKALRIVRGNKVYC